MVIDAKTLHRLQSETGLLLLDIRDSVAYGQSHIPGAVHAELETVNVTKPPVNGLLPEVSELNAALSALGLHANVPVVVYDQSGGPVAGRFAWTLKAFGHPEVALLNGGFQAWQTQSLPISDLACVPKFSDYQGRWQPARIANPEYVLAQLANPDVQLIDARTAAEFNGLDRRSARGGHIPGAIHLDWAETKQAAPNSEFKSTAEINALLESRGIHRDREQIVYCQSHQRSALLAFLLESSGYTQVRGYPGAWSDWGNNAQTPVVSHLS